MTLSCDKGTESCDAYIEACFINDITEYSMVLDNFVHASEYFFLQMWSHIIFFAIIDQALFYVNYLYLASFKDDINRMMHFCRIITDLTGLFIDLQIHIEISIKIIIITCIE